MNLDTTITRSYNNGMRIGDILIQKGYITKEQLEEALQYQSKYGGRLGWILASLGYINRLQFFEAIAEHYNLEFIKDVDYIINTIDESLLRRFDPFLLIEVQAIPYKVEDNKLTILTSYPKSIGLENFVNEHFKDYIVDYKVITDLDVSKILNHFFKDLYLDKAIRGLFYLSPEFSAARVFTKGQVFVMGLIIFFSLIWIYVDIKSYFIFLISMIQIFYFFAVGFKFIISIAGATSELEQYITDEEVQSLKDEELPVYTILVPVYKEPEVVGILINSLKKMDYPQNKLDVILLLEEDDKVTLEAAKSHRPPSNWRFLIVPNAIPKTKPKACNYGLFFSKGKYLTIYDAEDVPEPDQLKKCLVAFKKGGKDYICFQCALNYFNKDENFLTKMFTLEYSYWFDYLLPGLFNLKLPIPLGGTSNHFDVEKLKEVGAWDPFNTTEDADLGVRARAKNYKVGVVNSTTYEEANAHLGNWIRQRSRWIKGYMQTCIVYLRNNRALLKNVGFKGYIGFHLLICGTPLAFLANPIMWGVFLIWIITKSHIIESLFPSYILYISIYNLLFGNFIGIYLNMIAVFRRKYYSLLPYAFLNPIYWFLHSRASYKALFELFTKPFYWQKTQHGITKMKIEPQKSI